MVKSEGKRKGSTFFVELPIDKGIKVDKNVKLIDKDVKIDKNVKDDVKKDVKKEI